MNSLLKSLKTKYNNIDNNELQENYDLIKHTINNLTKDTFKNLIYELRIVVFYDRKYNIVSCRECEFYIITNLTDNLKQDKIDDVDEYNKYNEKRLIDIQNRNLKITYKDIKDIKNDISKTTEFKILLELIEKIKR